MGSVPVVQYRNLYLARNSQFSSFTQAYIFKKMAGPLRCSTKKIQMFSWPSKQCLAGVQALVGQPVYIIFRGKIHRHDVFRSKSHIVRQVVIIFVLFTCVRRNYGESLQASRPQSAVINSKQNSHQTQVSVARNNQIPTLKK